MTLDELKGMDELFITPQVAAQLLGVNPHAIRVQAKTDPAQLGFPCAVIGTRVKIPRLPFIKFIEGSVTV